MAVTVEPAARSALTVAVEPAAPAVVAAATLAAFLIGLAGVHRARGRAQGLGEDFALVNPDLHADTPECRGGLGETVLNVGADGLQGNRAFVVMLHAGDFASAQTTGTAGLNALRPGAHGAGHRVFHGAAVADTLFELLRDILGDELRVHVGVLDFHDVEARLFANHLFERGAVLLNLLAALPDNHAGAGAVQENRHHVVAPLNLDTGNARAVEGLFEELADFLVLYNQVADFLLTGVPAGVPVLDDAHAQSVGINFLSHNCLPYAFSATLSVT